MKEHQSSKGNFNKKNTKVIKLIQLSPNTYEGSLILENLLNVLLAHSLLNLSILTNLKKKVIKNEILDEKDKYFFIPSNQSSEVIL